MNDRIVPTAMKTSNVNGNGVKREEPKEEEEEDLFWASSESEGEQEEHFALTKKKIPKKDIIQFGEVLAEPIPKRYTCEALCKMIEKGQIDLEPEYQRGVVWSIAKQSAVIDSIFRNCYVPPVLFSIHTQENEDGDVRELRICVDGKQRLTSIHLFMNNKIPLKEPQTGRSFYFRPRPRHKCLTEAQREKFSQINMNCIEYHGLEEEQERDMFQRVQMGVTLSPAERLSANLGAWPDLFRQMVKRFIDNDDFTIRHILATDRGRDFQYMCMISLLILNCKDPKYTIGNNDVLKFLKLGGAPTESQKKSIIATVTRLTALCNDYENNGPLLPLRVAGPINRNKPIAPIEFLYAGYICYLFSQASFGQLSQLIKGMTERVRGEHVDVFMNTKVQKTLRNYINEMELQHAFWLTPDRINETRKRRHEDEFGEDEEWTPGTQQLSVVQMNGDY